MVRQITLISLQTARQTFFCFYNVLLITLDTNVLFHPTRYIILRFSTYNYPPFSISLLFTIAIKLYFLHTRTTQLQEPLLINIPLTKLYWYDLWMCHSTQVTSDVMSSISEQENPELTHIATGMHLFPQPTRQHL